MFRNACCCILDVRMEDLGNKSNRWCTQVVHILCSLSSSCHHSTGPSSEIKMAYWGCEIKIMALKALSSWSSQNLPYGPLGLVLFLHSVLSNMLGEIRVQPACLSANESTELWSMTGIHPNCSHSNKIGLMCSKWPGGSFIEDHFHSPLSQKSLLMGCKCQHLHVNTVSHCICGFNIWMNSWDYFLILQMMLCCLMC